MTSYTSIRGGISSASACETFRKRAARLWTCAVLATICMVAGSSALRAQAPTPAAPAAPRAADAKAPAPAHVESAQPSPPPGHAPQPSTAPAATPAGQQPHAPAGRAPTPVAGDAHGGAPAHEATGAHGPSLWALAGRLFNFLLLVGGLVYVLRGPLGLHLRNRRQEIGGDLDAARATAARATGQLAEIDRRLADLPAELDALRARGAEEIAAEEAAIRQRAETERQRLLAQTRREIELEVRLARRRLVEHTADLAVKLAADRVTGAMGDDDRQRLLDQYVSRVKELHG